MVVCQAVFRYFSEIAHLQFGKFGGLKVKRRRMSLLLFFCLLASLSIFFSVVVSATEAEDRLGRFLPLDEKRSAEHALEEVLQGLYAPAFYRTMADLYGIERTDVRHAKDTLPIHVRPCDQRSLVKTVGVDSMTGEVRKFVRPCYKGEMFGFWLDKKGKKLGGWSAFCGQPVKQLMPTVPHEQRTVGMYCVPAQSWVIPHSYSWGYSLSKSPYQKWGAKKWHPYAYIWEGGKTHRYFSRTDAYTVHATGGCYNIHFK